MNTSYESDVVAWAKEQAALIRSGHFDKLDLINNPENCPWPMANILSQDWLPA